MSEQATKPKSEQTEVGALWQKEGQTQKFLAGNLDFTKFPENLWAEFVQTKRLPVVIFNNKFKQKDTHPDLRIYLSKPKPDSTPAPVRQVAQPAPEVDNDIV